jgi:hypothetical protein
MGTNCAVYLANFYSFPRSLIFFTRLLKCNSCPVVLQTLFLVCRFVDDHFIVDFLDSVMYLVDSFGGYTYPKITCELNCTWPHLLPLGFNLTKVQVLLCDIFGKHSH